MTNISETQSATCRKVEKHLINYSAGEVTKASSSTVTSFASIAKCWQGEVEYSASGYCSQNRVPHSAAWHRSCFAMIIIARDRRSTSLPGNFHRPDLRTNRPGTIPTGPFEGVSLFSLLSKQVPCSFYRHLCRHRAGSVALTPAEVDSPVSSRAISRSWQTVVH
jgi:hypothetical protein